MRTMLVGWMIVVAALGAGCGHSAEVQSDVEAQRALFAQVAPATYKVTWQKTCDACVDDLSQAVEYTIADGQITDPVYRVGGQPVSDAVRNSLTTVEGVFDLIADRLDDAYRVNVTYDPTLHYPSDVDVTIYQSVRSDGDMRLSLALDPTPTPSTPPAPSKPELRAELARQRALFVAPASYSFTERTDCFCSPEFNTPVRISVTASAITHAAYAPDTQPLPDNVRATLMTVPGLFDLLAHDLADDSGIGADEIRITYDPVLHVPSSYHLSGELADSSFTQSMMDFVTPADAP